jgi:CubicO group peptidase (beta-lactamase class C family)
MSAPTPSVFIRLTLFVLLGVFARSAEPAAEPWRAATPESQGFSSAKLEAMQAGLAARKTKALLVIRNDAIVCEWYAPDFSASQKHGTASLAKAIVGGLSFAVAMSDGRIALDDPAVKFIPQWRDDPRKARITLRQLGSHTSGIEDADEEGKSHDQLPGWKGEFWKRLPVPNDPFTVARDRAPLIFEPGEKMAYSNPGIALMTYCVTAALRDAPQKDIRSLIRERVMKPIGITDAEWSAGYGQTFLVDGLPLVGSWGGGSYTARAAARVGRLMLRGGDWDGQRILSADAVRLTPADAGTPGPCGMGWWSNNEGDCAKLPRDAFFGSGAGHEIVLVIPSLQIIVVRFGDVLAETAKVPGGFHEPYRQFLFDPLMEAINGEATDSAPTVARETSTSPYPPSPVIRGMEWAPADTILRLADGSDNWPMTWADDDALYTAYGDGNGFAPFVKDKLSLGLGKVTGKLPEILGVNIRSESAEALGNGKRGRKASGILCVDGVLYLLVRNVTNSQLGWSSDHGATWTWAEWKFTESFGCPTFLNFGKNYAGARDGFVYLYSQDSDNAYERVDRFVMARVPKDKLRERTAYEFFVKLAASGQPVWSKEIVERGAVFTNPGACYRSGISYDAGLRRYLWCQIGPGRDTRFAGGFAIYDALEPWGPWTTVFHTDAWDVGPGETNSLPTKWMSDDGSSVHLVFSNEDHFAVRSGTMVLRDSAKH